MKILELKSTITEMKISLQDLKSRFDLVEKRISELVDQQRLSNLKNRKKRMKKNEESLRDLQDNIKCTNIPVIGVSEREENEQGRKKYLKNNVHLLPKFDEKH